MDLGPLVRGDDALEVGEGGSGGKTLEVSEVVESREEGGHEEVSKGEWMSLRAELSRTRRMVDLVAYGLFHGPQNREFQSTLR